MPSLPLNLLQCLCIILIKQLLLSNLKCPQQITKQKNCKAFEPAFFPSNWLPFLSTAVSTHTEGEDKIQVLLMVECGRYDLKK